MPFPHNTPTGRFKCESTIKSQPLPYLGLQQLYLRSRFNSFSKGLGRANFPRLSGSAVSRCHTHDSKGRTSYFWKGTIVTSLTIYHYKNFGLRSNLVAVPKTCEGTTLQKCRCSPIPDDSWFVRMRWLSNSSGFCLASVTDAPLKVFSPFPISIFPFRPVGHPIKGHGVP